MNSFLNLLLLQTPIPSMHPTPPTNPWWMWIVEGAIIYGITHLVMSARGRKKNAPIGYSNQARTPATAPEPTTANPYIEISDAVTNPYYSLSIWANRPFYVDGILCSSLYSFLCSLYFKDPAQQESICRMVLSAAESLEVEGKENWSASGELYWAGQRYDRDLSEYQDLLRKAIRAKFESPENKDIFAFLKSTGDKPLIETSLPTDTGECLLSSSEYVKILSELRQPNKDASC